MQGSEHNHQRGDKTHEQFDSGPILHTPCLGSGLPRDLLLRYRFVNRQSAYHRLQHSDTRNILRRDFQRIAINDD